MKINFDKLFSTSIDFQRVILLFGNDVETQDRALHFLKKQKVSLVEFSEKEFLNLDSIDRPPLFSELESQTYLISNVTEKTLKKIENLNSEKCFICISTSLRANSTFVKSLQSMKEGLAISCYESPLVRAEVNFFLKEYNLPPNILNLAYNKFLSRPEEFYNFLKILALCADVDISSLIETYLSSTPCNISDDLLCLLLSNDRKHVSTKLPVPIDKHIGLVRMVLRSFMILYELKSIDYQKQLLSTPLFFKDEPTYLSAARKWTSQEVKNVLESFIALEKDIKYSSSQTLNYKMFHMEQ